MKIASFNDPQGMSHTDAVLYIRTAHHNRSEREHFLLSSTDFTTVENPAPTVTDNITYSVYYWLSAAAKAAGAAPYILANTADMDMDFTFTPDSTYDGLTLEEKCEKHLEEVVLPPLQV